MCREGLGRDFFTAHLERTMILGSRVTIGNIEDGNE